MRVYDDAQPAKWFSPQRSLNWMDGSPLHLHPPPPEWYPQPTKQAATIISRSSSIRGVEKITVAAGLERGRVRGHVHMMSAKFWGLSTPPTPPCPHFTQPISTVCWQNLEIPQPLPSPPLRRRPLWMVPNVKRTKNITWSRQRGLACCNYRVSKTVIGIQGLISLCVEISLWKKGTVSFCFTCI